MDVRVIATKIVFDKWELTSGNCVWVENISDLINSATLFTEAFTLRQLKATNYT